MSQLAHTEMNRLVAQVYEKTHTLAINLERVTADHLDLIELCDGLVSEYIGNYPQIELDWLAQMKRKQVEWVPYTPSSHECDTYRIIAGFSVS